MFLLPQAPPAPRASTVVGRLVIVPFESKVLGNRRNLRIWFPPKFDAKRAASYPVLVMHDAQNLFDGATSYIPGGEWRVDETATMLIGAKLIPSIVVVGIDNGAAERANEYLPTRFTMRDQLLGGKADLFLKAIDTEILPTVSAKYGLSTRRFGMIGSSFGGVITLYAATKFGPRLDRIGVVSPSVWVNGREPLGWAGKVPKGTRIWLDIGEKEGDSADRNARDLRDALVKTGHRVAYAQEPNAEHNEGAWARRLPAILLELYGR